MAGKIYITNCSSEKCGVGMSLPTKTNSELIIDRFVATECDVGILQRDPLSLASSLGLPLDTPPQLIIEAAKALQGENVTYIEKITTLSSLPIWTYLNRATDAAKAVAALIGAAKAIASSFQLMG